MMLLAIVSDRFGFNFSKLNSTIPATRVTILLAIGSGRLHLSPTSQVDSQRPYIIWGNDLDLGQSEKVFQSQSFGQSKSRDRDFY